MTIEGCVPGPKPAFFNYPREWGHSIGILNDSHQSPLGEGGLVGAPGAKGTRCELQLVGPPTPTCDPWPTSESGAYPSFISVLF